MKTLQAYRFVLDPNGTQRAGLRRHAGASRFTCNWGQARVKAALSQRAAEETYGVTGDGLTPVPWMLPALRLAWNAAKREIAPWWDECSKEAFSAGLDRLARALKNFTDSRKGQRKGQRKGRRVGFPRIGRARVHEPMDALTGRLADGRARLLGATVSRTADRWFVSFTAQVDRDTPAEPSRRQRAAELAHVHARIVNQRRDGLHKLTTRLVKTHDVVVVEDLNVTGMVRNRRLAKAVATAGFAEIRRQLAYKTDWYGSALHVADRWYPSSKTCSGCGWRDPSLTLAGRTFACQSCGLVLDRDLNAAVNLRTLVAASASETEDARGADRKTHPGGQVATKREPGTARAGQTGSAAPQGTAA
ncbi:transposase [Frankia tisae]|uniref:transposase n=1 Tax=Frankia tisae TaxID=2950104 RepID=UPI0021C12D8E|nr:transposase [Frankia tisae]